MKENLKITAATATATAKDIDAYMSSHYPKIYSILKKVSQKEGFTLSEVRKYRAALRSLVMLPEEEKERLQVEDKAYVSLIVFWAGTEQGYDFWYDLTAKLYKVDVI